MGLCHGGVAGARAEHGSRFEASGYKYDDKAKQLVFNSGVLSAQDDTLAVDVAHECHRIIR